MLAATVAVIQSDTSPVSSNQQFIGLAHRPDSSNTWCNGENRRLASAASCECSGECQKQKLCPRRGAWRQGLPFSVIAMQVRSDMSIHKLCLSGASLSGAIGP